MADPLSIAAILGIIFVGRKLSNTPAAVTAAAAPKLVSAEKVLEYPTRDDSRSLVLNHLSSPGLISEPVNKKQETGNFGDIAFSQYVHGEPTHDLSSRYFVSSKMNNLPPAEKIFVGRGLGLDPSVPASGGFQQLYRVNPNNVGAYKLTTLPGRIAPGGDTTGWRAGTIGDITHYSPAKTAFLPARRPLVEGRAQGQGDAVTGPTGRESYEKTKRTTKRAETGLRTDGLEYAPAKRIVPTQTTQQAPSRNKGDLNAFQFDHTNNPAPGIHSFVGGYTNEPLNQAMERRGPHGNSDQQLDMVGFKVDDKRGQVDRAGNAGRMNIRASPLNQGGLLTAVRSDSDASDNYFGTAGPTQGNGQNYTNDQFYQFNAFKGQPGRNTLDLAKNQLAGNPFAHSLS